MGARVPGADECECDYCKNFALQRGSAFPHEFVYFLKGLGIDPLKEWEAFDYGLSDGKYRLYGGWFLFRGELVGGEEPQLNFERAPFSYWLTDSFPTGTLPAGVKFCAVAFLVRLPWMIESDPN